MASKHVSAQVTHELTVGLATVGSDTFATCTYANGERVHGPHPHAMHHPELRVSVGDQDCMLWTGTFPFVVELHDVPTGLFFRPQPWIAAEGRDGLFRAHSGPMNPPARNFLPKTGVGLKFTITKLSDSDSSEPDPGVHPLDPHIIVEP